MTEESSRKIRWVGSPRLHICYFLNSVNRSPQCPLFKDDWPSPLLKYTKKKDDLKHRIIWTGDEKKIGELKIGIKGTANAKNKVDSKHRNIGTGDVKKIGELNIGINGAGYDEKKVDWKYWNIGTGYVKMIVDLKL